VPTQTKAAQGHPKTRRNGGGKRRRWCGKGGPAGGAEGEGVSRECKTVTTSG